MECDGCPFVGDRYQEHYCKVCREYFSGSPAECQECEGRGPELWTENEEAYRLWLEVNTQWRAGGIGIVGLDYGALQFCADTIGIVLTPAIMVKIRLLESYELKRAADKLRDVGGGEPGGKRSANYPQRS